MHFLAKIGLCGSLVVGLSACGGGSDSTNPTSSSSNMGIFLDSPVMGLSYESPSHSGITNSAGEFRYTDGETVSFSLGGIELGSSLAQEEITPLDLLGVDSVNEAISNGLMDQLINMLVFLQSLDRDHNPDNGIDLGDLNVALADEELIFDQDQDTFQSTAFKRIINENSGAYVNAGQAQQHFIKSLSLSFTAELPSKDYLDFNGDNINDVEVSYLYDNDGKLIEIFEAPIGEVSMPPMAKTTLQYDNKNRLSMLTYEDLENEVLLVEREYSYDLLGRLTSLVETDAQDLLLSQESWEYDEVGNELRHEYLISADGVESYQANENPFDLYYKIEPYNPNKNIQVPLMSVFDSHIPISFESSLGGGFVEVSSYENNGELASNESIFSAEHQFLGPINSESVLNYEQGRKSSFIAETDIEFHQVFIETEIVFDYTEDGSPLSCRFISSQDGITSADIFVTYEPEPESGVSYSCGDIGFDEAIVVRDEEGRVDAILYNVYQSNGKVRRSEQTIIYEGDQLVGVVTETSIDNGAFIQDIFISGELSSLQYDYTETGKLNYIEDSFYGGRRWMRDYELVEIR